VIENQSPYYLYPSEVPKATITSLIFNGKNYDLSQKVVQTPLKLKNKLRFIDETLIRPKPKEGDDPTELNIWEIVNSMICSWIVNVNDSKLHTNAAYAETAQATWENLCKRYDAVNAPKIHKLKADLACCTQ